MLSEERAETVFEGLNYLANMLIEGEKENNIEEGEDPSNYYIDGCSWRWTLDGDWAQLYVDECILYNSETDDECAKFDFDWGDDIETVVEIIKEGENDEYWGWMTDPTTITVEEVREYIKTR